MNPIPKVLVHRLSLSHLRENLRGLHREHLLSKRSCLMSSGAPSLERLPLATHNTYQRGAAPGRSLQRAANVCLRVAFRAPLVLHPRRFGVAQRHACDAIPSHICKGCRS
jgi:hypothetical protein